MAKGVDKITGEGLVASAEKQSTSISKPGRGGVRANSGGTRLGAGRKRGGKNKLTKDMKTAIEQAFNNVGGVAYLETIAVEHPAVFCALIGKIIPLQVTTEDDGPLEITWLTVNDNGQDNA